MKEVVTKAATSIGAETAAIALKEGNEWIVRCTYCVPKDSLGTKLEKQGLELAEIVLEKRETLVIDDTSKLRGREGRT